MRTSSTLPLRDLSGLASAYSSQQLQITALETGLASQASNGNFLAAMTAASGAFSIGRALGTSLFSNVLGGAGLRGAAWVLGFTSEVLAFRGANQILNPGSESWLDASGLASTATDFLLLKGAGVFCATSSYGVRQFVQASAMVGGEYAGESIGVREQSGQAFSERFAHALATGVAMEAGGLLMRRATAGRIEALQRNLEQQASARVQATEMRDAQIQSSPQMAANVQHPERLANLIEYALHGGSTFRPLLDHVEKYVGQGNLYPMIEAAKRVTQVAEALVDTAFREASLFETRQITSLIEVGKTQPLVRKALLPLVRGRSRHFTTQHLTDILAYPEPSDSSVMEAVHDLVNARGCDFFTKDHVPTVIRLARENERMAGVLVRLMLERREIFTAAHLPAMREATLGNRLVESVFVQFVNSHYREILTRDAFLALVRAEEARGANGQSYLFGFTRMHFDFFDGETLRGVIEAAKTQSVAASILRILAGSATEGYTEGHADRIHGGFTTGHVPGIIEAAKNQAAAAMALSGLMLSRRILFAPEHIPGVIEAACAHHQAVNALSMLVDSYPDSFTRDHVAAMLKVTIAHWNSSWPLNRLLQARPELREAIPIAGLIEGAREVLGAAELLSDVVQIRPDLFTADHLPGMINAATRHSPLNMRNSESIELLLRRRPELVTPDTFIRLVEAAELQPAVKSFLLEFTRSRSAYFIEDYLPPLLEAAKTTEAAGNVLYELAQARMELFTVNHMVFLVRAATLHPAAGAVLDYMESRRSDNFRDAHVLEMIEGSKAHAGVAATLSRLAMSRPELFESHHIPGAIEVMSIHPEGAMLVDSLITQSSELFSREHVPAMIEAARNNKAAAKALFSLVRAQPNFFTPAQLREVIAVMHHWLYANATPMS